MRVLGIDPSLNSTGLAYRHAGDPWLASIRAMCVTNPKGFRGAARLVHVRDAVMAHVANVAPDLVVMEGYSYGSGAARSNVVFDLGELGGVLRTALYEREIRTMIVPPSVLKMFVTGKGNAKKEQLAAVISAEYGLQFSKSDQYDAAGLLIMGEAYLNRRLLPRDARHHKRRALVKCSFLS